MSGTECPTWGIVGGGVLGMTLALRLAQAGQKVTLIEQAPSLGGLATAWRLGDAVWDRHYHVILLSDTHIRSLLAELGLEQDMRWVHARTGFYVDDRLLSLSNALDFLRFPPLGMIAKLRLAATILYVSRMKNRRRLERIPVTRWLRRWSGAQTTDRIWIPLLRSKLGDDSSDVSAALIWATIDRMYAARRSGLKQEMFGYVPGGYGRVLDTLQDRLANEDVRLMTETRVEHVRADTSGTVTVATAEGRELRFDHVVLTVPAPAIARLCPDLREDEQSRLRAIQYQGIVCASLLLKKPLAGFYITNLTAPWLPFTAVIEMSALVGREPFGGNTLVYLPRYLSSNDPCLGAPEDEWRGKLLAGLFRMYPELTDEDVLAFRMSRERYVHPLWTLGYSANVPSRTTSMPGVFVVNSTQIVDAIPTVDQAVRLAHESLPGLLEAARQRSAEGPRWRRSR